MFCDVFARFWLNNVLTDHDYPYHIQRFLMKLKIELQNSLFIFYCVAVLRRRISLHYAKINTFTILCFSKTVFKVLILIWKFTVCYNERVRTHLWFKAFRQENF